MDKLCKYFLMDMDLDNQAQEIYDRIIKEIVNALKSSPLSETEIAEMCGLSQPAINRIKRGIRGSSLPLKTVLKLALVLQIDLTTLYLSSNQTQAKLKSLLSEISKMIVNE